MVKPIYHSDDLMGLKRCRTLPEMLGKDLQEWKEMSANE
jgi:hypothetical protein